MNPSNALANKAKGNYNKGAIRVNKKPAVFATKFVYF